METKFKTTASSDDGCHQNKATQIVRLLLTCGAVLQREGNRVVQPYGIKQQQFVVLNEIVRRSPVCQKDLVGELLFEKSNVSKIVKLLRKYEMIQIDHDPSDQRVTILRATQKGRDIWEACMHAFNQLSASFVAALANEDIDDIVRVLETLMTSMEKKRL